jgi:hypothetical protein
MPSVYKRIFTDGIFVFSVLQSKMEAAQKEAHKQSGPSAKNNLRYH